uniref:Uncharacterized protein n=1 Tax=Arundo donax TaxID=35708 RepID=A0A0A9G1J5_ARUDO
MQFLVLLKHDYYLLSNMESFILYHCFFNGGQAVKKGRIWPFH